MGKVVPQAVVWIVAAVCEYGQYIVRTVSGRELTESVSVPSFLAMQMLDSDVTMNGDKFDAVFGPQRLYTFAEGVEKTSEWLQTLIGFSRVESGRIPSVAVNGIALLMPLLKCP